MPPRGPDPQSASPAAGDALRRAADALVRLVKEHLALARIELRTDLRRAGRDAVFALAGVPLVIVGWALLMVALAIGIAPWVGNAGGFAAVAALNLVVGGGVTLTFAKKLTGDDRPDLDETTKELQEDRRWLQSLTRAQLGIAYAAGNRKSGRPGVAMTEIHREIDRARDDLALALGDLDLAARRVVTAEHWKAVAERAFRRRPGTFLAAAALAGFWLGRPRRRRTRSR